MTVNKADNMLKDIISLITKRVNKCRNLDSPSSSLEDITQDILLKLYQNPEYAARINNNEDFDKISRVVNTITSRHLSQLFKESYTFKNKIY